MVNEAMEECVGHFSQVFRVMEQMLTEDERVGIGILFLKLLQDHGLLNQVLGAYFIWRGRQ